MCTEAYLMLIVKKWKGNTLDGIWRITRKADGVRMLRDKDGNPISKHGKPLYNLQDIPKKIVDAEIYDKDWATSVSLVRTKINGKPVSIRQAYSIDPIDERLDMGYVNSPSPDYINTLLKRVVAQGWEGLVLRQGDVAFKVKPVVTVDIRVTGFQWGTGKHKGKMGALLTAYGKVGTGFSDADRMHFADEYIVSPTIVIGTIIEVDAMGWTPNKKLRHAVFKRTRWDKDNESLEQ